MLQVFDINSDDQIIELNGMRNNYKEKLESIQLLDEEIIYRLTVQEEIEYELADTLVRNDKHAEYLIKMDRYLEKATPTNLMKSGVILLIP